MSVSALDVPVPHSPLQKPPSKVDPKTKGATTAQTEGQKNTSIGFNAGDNKPGKLFANQAPARHAGTEDTRTQGDARQTSATDAETTGAFDQLKQKLKGWCNGPRPPKPDPCLPPPCYGKPPTPPKPCPPPPPPPCPPPPPKPCPPTPPPCSSRPPERPTPCRPDPCYGRPDPWYANKSNDQLLGMLLNSFNAFKDPARPGYITTQSLSDMANRPLTGNPAQDRNVRLARELMKRPEVVNAVDRHSTTGILDGLIDRQKIAMILSSQSPLKYSDDSQLAAQMLQNFGQLSDPRNPSYISIDNLRRLANVPTSHPTHGHLAWIAQEVLKRAAVMGNMDGGDYWGKDGWIHIDTLRRMSR